MRAVICKELGPPEKLVIEDVPDPEVKKGQVRIAMKAAGVNFPDVLIIQGRYQFEPDGPFSPGGELAGVVDAVGEGVTRVKVGDRVVAIVPWGAFAEKVVVEADAVLPLPLDVPDEVAAGFVLAYATTLYALKDRARLKAGETLAVLGAAGGVGLAAVEIGKALGARVIACASSADKLALCKEHGADELIDYQRENLKDRLKSLSGGMGVDVVYDPVGGPYSEAALRAIGWEGRFLVVGFAAGDIPKIPLNLVLLKSCQIVGVFWGMFTARDPERFREHVKTLLGWLREGKLRPHVDRVHPLIEAPLAIRALMDREAKGKIVIVP
jgi:NADPH:quinone reductase